MDRARLLLLLSLIPLRTVQSEPCPFSFDFLLYRRTSAKHANAKSATRVQCRHCASISRNGIGTQQRGPHTRDAQQAGIGSAVRRTGYQSTTIGRLNMPITPTADAQHLAHTTRTLQSERGEEGLSRIVAALKIYTAPCSQ